MLNNKRANERTKQNKNELQPTDLWLHKLNIQTGLSLPHKYKKATSEKRSRTASFVFSYIIHKIVMGTTVRVYGPKAILAFDILIIIN